MPAFGDLPQAVRRQAPADALSEVIDALSEGLAVFDEKGLLIRSNPGYRVLNPLVSDLILPGLDWDVLLRECVARGAFSPLMRERLEWMETRLASGDGFLHPLDLEMPNGAVHEIALRPTATGGFLVTQKDITQRRKYEENERQADLLLRKVLEACPANVVMSRVADGQIIYRSPAATELLGTSRSAHDHFAHREERADFVTALLPDGRVDDMPITGVRPDGSHFPCLISARLIEYRGEEVSVSSTVDVSKEVALRRTLAAQREQIFQAEKMSALGELLAGVAHELNNPLSVVVGHALMMHEETTDPEILRRIEKIGEAAERCGRIVKSFLAMARQQPVRLAPIDVREVFETAIDALNEGADGLGTAVELDVPAALPRVHGDRHQITQVAINLITNADQAIRESGKGDLIRVSARLAEPPDMIEIRVADNGPGVPEAIRNRIFNPLFTTKEAGRGTGIGLAFSHRVLSAHSGRIRLDPTVAEGATIVLHLPVAQEGESLNGDDVGDDQPDPSGHVLVVDDEPAVAEMIKEILVKDGFVVDSAGSAERALDAVRRRAYALILTDLNMPGMGGRGFYQTVLRERPALAPRIAFVTGDTMGPQARAFLDSAGQPCIEKPIAPAELRRLVRDMLGAMRREAV